MATSVEAEANSQRPQHHVGRPPVAQLRVAFHTLGCRSNYADTVDIQSLCIARGATPRQFTEDADVYVLNSCTVTDNADQEVFRILRKTKARRPDARVVVTGCLASVGRERLIESGLVDQVIPPGERAATVEAIFSDSAADSTDAEKGSLLNAPLLPLPRSTPAPGERHGSIVSRHRFHLRVQEGCENHCTFCIIPAARGDLRSLAPEGVLSDLNRLVELGYQEVVLTGTHLGGYGEDIGSSLYELLRLIERSGFPLRVRLSSIDPNDVTPEILALLAESNIFCHHLHICVQAFSDRVLKLMNRRYRLGAVERLVEQVVRKLPGCGIGTDVIAGFPGERREDVDQGIDLFLGLPFSYLHVFPYSERDGTAATRLRDSVPLAERKRRAERWRAIGERRRLDFYRSLVGRDLEVILDGGDGDLNFGTSREFARVAVRRQAQVPHPFGTRLRVIGVQVDEMEGVLLCE